MAKKFSSENKDIKLQVQEAQQILIKIDFKNYT